MAETTPDPGPPGPAEDKEEKGSSEEQQVSTNEQKDSTDPTTVDADRKSEGGAGGSGEGVESASAVETAPEGQTEGGTKDQENDGPSATEPPTTEGEEGKPAAVAEGDKPATVAEGDKPATEGEGGKPATEGEGDKPAAVAEEDKPATEGEGDKPAAEAEGDKPATEVEGDKPATEGEGDKPAAEAEGDKPATEAEGGKPATESEGDKPATEGEGDKPATEAEGDKPATEAEGDKPATEAEGDKPATEAEGDKPATEGEGETKEGVESGSPPAMTTLTSEHASLACLQPAPLEDIVEEEEIDREAIYLEIKEALTEQEKLRTTNRQLQHKIAEYLTRKKTEERPDPGRNVTDQEKRYMQCLGALDSLEQELLVMHEGSEKQEHELKVLRDRKLAEVNQATAEFAMYKRENAVTAVHTRTGKRLTQQEVDQYQAAEDRKEQDVIQVRLENVKLQNKIHKLESLVKQKEQLAEGLHMIDFEQLKINNVDLNGRIEERNEDITKLRKKITATVQVLTHVKEKLQFLQAENSEKKGKLQEVESLVAKKRDHLTRMKQARDALRTDNIRLRQKGGLVSHSALLRDFEERKDQSEALQEKLEDLQRRHSELTIHCDGLRRRIEQARTMPTQL